ncbi:MAG: hypothetical protein Q7R76_01515 [Candidatus Woesearchaeota archaeon]|nr:hypothetical protein [Candidatus Woesearchaeota archaeon]
MPLPGGQYLVRYITREVRGRQTRVGIEILDAKTGKPVDNRVEYPIHREEVYLRIRKEQGLPALPSGERKDDVYAQAAQARRPVEYQGPTGVYERRGGQRTRVETREGGLERTLR